MPTRFRRVMTEAGRQQMRSPELQRRRWETFKARHPQWATAVETARAAGERPCDLCGGKAAVLVDRETFEFIAWRCYPCRSALVQGDDDQ